MTRRSFVSVLGLLVRDRRGEAVVGMALVLPFLVFLSIGILELTLAVLEFQRAGEGTRRGARIAAISDPIADVGGFTTGSSILCKQSGGAVFCEGAPAARPEVFEAIVLAVRDIFPLATAANIEVSYRDSGIGDPASPGGIAPLVTVRLVGVAHPFAALHAVPGVPPAITLPSLDTTQIGRGLGTTAST